MSRRERVAAALARQPVDRVPYAFWRHFPTVDRNPARLAQATLRFHDRYGGDFLKITPPGGWTVEAWGCVEGDHVEADGHRPCATCAVRNAADWRGIRALDPASAEGYTQQMETIVRIGFDRRIGDAPVIATLVSPLSLAGKLSGGRLAADLAEHPQAVRDALAAITETLVRFADLVLAEGVSGIFYAVHAASLDLRPASYAEFGEPYDRAVLEAVRGRSSLTIVHAHGTPLPFERLARLPAGAWNWHDRGTPPTLDEAQALVPGAVIGGLDHAHTLRQGAADDAVAEARDAIARTGGAGLIVGPGCVLPPDTPDATLAAVVRALGGPLKPIPGIAS